MRKIFELIGRYFILMGKVFSRPEKAAIYRRRIVYAMESLGIDSLSLIHILQQVEGIECGLVPFGQSGQQFFFFFRSHSLTQN